jgi:hypothetical protein
MASSALMEDKFQGFWKPIPLHAFLQTFLGIETFIKLFGGREHLISKSLVVRIGQFVKFNNDISTRTLLDYFNYGCGIVCQNYQKGCDLVIPIFDDIVGNGDTPLDIKYMTCLIIQVKYRKRKETGATYEKHVVDHLSKKYCDITGISDDTRYYTLYIDIGADHTPSVEFFEAAKEPRRVCMSVIGYNIYHMVEDGICKSFLGFLYKSTSAHDNQFIGPKSRHIFNQDLRKTHMVG